MCYCKPRRSAYIYADIDRRHTRSETIDRYLPLLQNGIVPFDIGKHIGKRQKQPRLFVIFLFVRGHHQMDMLQLYRVRVYIDFPFADRRFQTKPNAVKGMRIPRRSAQRNQILHGFVFARAAVNRNGHGHIVFCRGLTMATRCIACKNGVLKGRIRSTAIFSDGSTANRYIKKKAYCTYNRLSRGGREWIRTTEVVDGRFTVCSLWPLGNSPIFNFPPDCFLNGAHPHKGRVRFDS